MKCLLFSSDKLIPHQTHKLSSHSKFKWKLNYFLVWNNFLFDFSFNEVLPLIDGLLSKTNTINNSTGNASNSVATNDRMLQLLIKGILYESCVDYCQQKATGTSPSGSGDTIQVNLSSGWFVIWYLLISRSLVDIINPWHPIYDLHFE